MVAAERFLVDRYPIGIPTLTLLLLLKNGQQIKEQDSKARQRYEFLVADYKPQFYFWDCFEMLRKVSITGILMFVGQQGSLFQLVVGIILCVGFGFTAAWFHPYGTRDRGMLHAFSGLIQAVVCWQ